MSDFEIIGTSEDEREYENSCIKRTNSLPSLAPIKAPPPSRSSSFENLSVFSFSESSSDSDFDFNESDDDIEEYQEFTTIVRQKFDSILFKIKISLVKFITKVNKFIDDVANFFS